MSWRSAGALAREWAAEQRRQADALAAPPSRVAQFDDGDRPALVAWLKRRIAQEHDRFANACEQQAREDVTVSERGPRG